MHAGLLDMLHHPADEDVLAVGDGIDVNLDGVTQVPVEQNRTLARHDHGLGDVAGELRLVVHDFHGTPAEHIRWTDHEREAEPGRNRVGLLHRAGDAALGLTQAKPVDHRLESVAVLGEVNRVRRRAEDRNLGVFQRLGELERRLPAELHNHALYLAVLGLFAHDLEHVLFGQRLEIKPV